MVKLKTEFPAGFFDEEVRDGYLISSQMKEIWAVEIDLLLELLRVCKEHDIKIFCSGGTMLGAVRHKGFIPWDDDIDMMMFREDYDKLCSVSDEFKHPYFFQTEYTDRGSLRGHAQLRNSETTAILSKQLDRAYSFNQGIFIDIFPLDAVSDDEKLMEKQEKKVEHCQKMSRRFSRYSTRYYLGQKDKITDFIYRCFHNLFSQISLLYCKKIEHICRKFNGEKTELVSTLSFIYSNKQHYKYRRDYEETIDMPFEFFSVPVGKEYDEGLRKRYGNYTEFVVGQSCHGQVFFDTGVSYIEYVEERRNKQLGK